MWNPNGWARIVWWSSKYFTILSHCLEANLVLIFEMSAIFEPGREVLALADIKRLQLVTAVRHCLYPGAGDSNAATNR